MLRYLLSIFAVLFSVLCVSKTQELMEQCFTCDDALDRCELDCVLPVFREDSVLAWPYEVPATKLQVDKCSALCKSQRETCVDSTETITCNKCMVSCSKEYETNMLTCLDTQDKTKKSTFGANLDSCANSVSKAMDTCTQTCYGGKRLFRWTPEAERGETHTPYVFDEENFAKQLEKQTLTSSKSTSTSSTSTSSTSKSVSQSNTNQAPQTTTETQPNGIKSTTQSKSAGNQNKQTKPQVTASAFSQKQIKNPSSFSFVKVLSLSAAVVIAIVVFGVVVFVALTKQRLSV